MAAGTTTPVEARQCRHQQALERIWAVLAAPGQWSPDTLEDIARILAAHGHTLPEGDTFEITAEVAYNELGWPSATVTAGPVTIGICEPVDQIGTVRLRIATGDQTAGIHIDVDDHPVWRHDHTAGPTGLRPPAQDDVQSRHATGPVQGPSAAAVTRATSTAASDDRRH